MKERAQRLNARLEIRDRHEGSGTVIRVTLGEERDSVPHTESELVDDSIRANDRSAR